MQKLNFPTFEAKVQNSATGLQMYDILRKKYVVLTPEEWVRQHLVHYLINHKGYSPALMAVERAVKTGSKTRRYDLLTYNRKGQPYLIAECKAPEVKLNQNTLLQAADYNLVLGAEVLVITNGSATYALRWENKAWQQLPEIPAFLE